MHSDFNLMMGKAEQNQRWMRRHEERKYMQKLNLG
jgi:hypothetical protein